MSSSGTKGSYRLVGGVGELACRTGSTPLAARLDALDPNVRRLVADAAVLGSAFPEEALVAVSGQEDRVRGGLSELVRRDLFRSPATRCPRNAVATASPRRCSARSPTRRCPRRTESPGISRGGASSGHLRKGRRRGRRRRRPPLPRCPRRCSGRRRRCRSASGAIAEFVRAAERAERTGAPARAAVSFATAAELQLDESGAGQSARRGAVLGARGGGGRSHRDGRDRAADRSRETTSGRPGRAGARVQALAGKALRRAGRHGEAREQLTAAMDVLRTNPTPTRSAPSISWRARSVRGLARPTG